MKFRIHFKANGAFWCIQFLKYECFWVSVVGGVHDGERTVPKVLQFDTLADAEKYVRDRGIDDAYTRVEATHWDRDQRDHHPQQRSYA